MSSYEYNSSYYGLNMTCTYGISMKKTFQAAKLGSLSRWLQTTAKHNGAIAHAHNRNDRFLNDQFVISFMKRIFTSITSYDSRNQICHRYQICYSRKSKALWNTPQDYMKVNAKYITHCGYSIENNIASDIRLSRNVVNKESKRSRRFVCYCDTSSGDKNYCMGEQIMPSLGAKKAAETASRRFLKERIFLTRRTLGSAKTEYETLKAEVISNLVPQHSDEIVKVNEDIYRDVFMKCKTRQQTKFDKLTQPKSSRTVPSLANEEKWVINLSSRTITSSEEEILKKGLGFAVSPRRIPATEIICENYAGNMLILRKSQIV